MFFAAFMVMKIAFYIQNKEYFDLAAEQMQDGASWEYVGPRPTDPASRSIALEGLDGEKFILFKLKK